MTGDVLVFDDGYDGVAAVDLDDRTVSRRAIGGQEAGDQPWRLTLSGNDLIVGWDGVYADPVNGGSSRLLGNGTISVPAADPGDVWLVTYPAGRVGPGPLTVEEVTTDDRTVVPATTLTSPPGYPIVGVPGGIAFQSSAGLALWDAATQKVSQTLGLEPAASGPVGRRPPRLVRRHVHIAAPDRPRPKRPCRHTPNRSYCFPGVLRPVQP